MCFTPNVITAMQLTLTLRLGHYKDDHQFCNSSRQLDFEGGLRKPQAVSVLCWDSDEKINGDNDIS